MGAEKGVELILPVDFVCSSKFGDDGEIKNGDLSTGVPDGFLGLDIGPKSIELNDAAIAKSKTIVWNGPMGVFEMASFEAGTKRMMDKIVEVTAALGVELPSSCWKGSFCLVLQLWIMLEMLQLL